MLHPAGWGGWAFEVESIGNGGKTMNFSKGGNQEARGNSGCGAYYVEGIAEELDAPGEWVIEGSKLLLIPPAVTVLNFMILLSGMAITSSGSTRRPILLARYLKRACG